MTRSQTRRMIAASAVVGVSLALTLGACSKKDEGAKAPESSTTTTAASSGGTTVNQGPTVEITEFRFDPVPVEVKVGQVITWKNDGSARHTVTQDVPDEQRKFKSDTLAPGDKFVFTFTEPGTYTYICSVHPDRMRGTINVTAA
jgi:plastocyanin